MRDRGSDEIGVMSPQHHDWAVELRDVTRYFPTVPYTFQADAFNWIHSLTTIRKADTSPHFAALDHVSMSVKKGEFFGILGPNGAGKTTLMKILCGSLHPSHGRAYVEGHDVSLEPELVQERIAVIIGYFDMDTWGSRLTALENLSFYCRLQGISKQEAAEKSRQALVVVGLGEKADVRVGTFSAGMYQRLGIARGLVRDADVWLMDEPTIRLDPIGAEEIRNFIKETLNRGLGKTVLFATHYLEEARRLCDRIAILRKGKVVAEGSPADLLRSTYGTQQRTTLRVEGLADEAFRGIGRLEGVLGVRDLGAAREGGRGIEIRWEEPSAGCVLTLHEYIESRGGTVLDFTLTQPDMEDLFLHLTEEPQPQERVEPRGGGS